MPTKIIQPASRRLNSKIPHCGEAYIINLEKNVIHHHLIECLHEVHVSNLSQEEKQHRVCLTGNKGKNYMKPCRESMQGDQVFQDTVLSEGVHLDQEGSGVLLAAPVSQGSNSEQRQSETSSTKV
jgi:hypothetical protein